MKGTAAHPIETTQMTLAKSLCPLLWHSALNIWQASVKPLYCNLEYVASVTRDGIFSI